ncbi:MAG: 50S ribosomal protein L17 [Peptococcaceae bacterium]|nr:50S ribosomal protein L17 [Peptococcaceae bacterium]
MNYRKLNKNSGQRRAMLRSMTTSLIRHGRIQTTAARAKELRSVAEKMVTLGKQGDLAARRQALAYIVDEAVVKQLFDEVGPKYEERQGGYTRIVRLGNRKGDAAPMVMIELV